MQSADLVVFALNVLYALEDDEIKRENCDQIQCKQLFQVSLPDEFQIRDSILRCRVNIAHEKPQHHIHDEEYLRKLIPYSSD